MANGSEVKYSVFSWINSREYGSKKHSSGPRAMLEDIGSISRKLELHLWKSLYGGKACGESFKTSSCDGVFGLKYSPNGNVLVAACENKSLILLDPVTEKLIQQKQNAHRDCCNNVSFIDERLFASCSDDTNISVWDLRNFKTEVFRLQGHRNWVKNVELHKPTGNLVSSGFDDTVRLWDLNNVREDNKVTSEVLLKIDRLLRMRVSQCGSSMYLSSSAYGDVIGIHNLDLSTLSEDVGFIKIASKHQSLKTKKVLVSAILDHSQTVDVDSRNRIDRYIDSRKIARSKEARCLSMDVHPRDCALLMLYSGADDKVTTVCGTKRYYGHYCSSDEACVDSSCLEKYFPLMHGLHTNVLQYEADDLDCYIQEVCFSHCGRLISTPFGYGTTIAVFDDNFNDFETHILQKLDQFSAADNKHQSKTNKSKKMKMCSSELFEHDLNLCKFSVVKTCFGHQSPVLSSCFSPTSIQLATGSEKGMILFHNPVL